MPFGSTDCSLPMVWATEKKKEFDVFMVFTDNETYAGKVKPYEALRQYRKKLNIPDAKLVVVGMTATNFTIADPSDPGMLDVVGFDSAVPELVRSFVLGQI
uniref:VWFA domain-containing protein n=1 Tax=Acrobeloides nanus TaxID=290746 RepID=A0A914DGR6_9BILA